MWNYSDVFATRCKCCEIVLLPHIEGVNYVHVQVRRECETYTCVWEWDEHVYVKLKINMLFMIKLWSSKCVLCLFYQLADGGAQPLWDLGRWHKHVLLQRWWRIWKWLFRCCGVSILGATRKIVVTSTQLRYCGVLSYEWVRTPHYYYMPNAIIYKLLGTYLTCTFFLRESHEIS